MNRTSITAPAQLASRPALITAVAAACRAACGRPARDASAATLEIADGFEAEFVSAFSEIFNNIVLHSYAGGSDDEVVVELSHASDRLVVYITDHGAPFDDTATVEPDLDSLPEGGMGIFIARAFLDTARYQPGPPNQWTLEKCYPSGDAPSTT